MVDGTVRLSVFHAGGVDSRDGSRGIGARQLDSVISVDPSRPRHPTSNDNSYLNGDSITGMSESLTRLERRLADELGACRRCDVDDRVEALQDAAGSPDDAAGVLSVLGDDTRYRLARTLWAMDEELCVCELGLVVDVSDSAVSHALADLVAAGLATRRKAGTWRFYRSTPLADAVLRAAGRGNEDG